MHKNLVGQTLKQKRNCEEQKKRRADIEKQFPKTVTFHTYERITKKIEKRVSKLSAIYDKLGIKLRKCEIKSLAITSYIDISNNQDKSKLFKFIHIQIVKKNVDVDKLILSLNKEFHRKDEWDKKQLVDFLLFKDQMK